MVGGEGKAREREEEKRARAGDVGRATKPARTREGCRNAVIKHREGRGRGRIVKKLRKHTSQLSLSSLSFLLSSIWMYFSRVVKRISSTYSHKLTSNSNSLKHSGQSGGQQSKGETL
ncbi:hypothetical protein BP00DRAFT_115576 [Aspergillus indologenus CBS 114.80]|uniref:Uncharacterized protein n=1 Tax=Aspergillus indologenus CBS 114.80 TaxID=1450541 RepID=A0A2V5HRH6_9EURO|nr:hypothetical protein BP00DRAFT_115576 [Aspergillus indologenus CBS 114.80]